MSVYSHQTSQHDRHPAAQYLEFDGDRRYLIQADSIWIAPGRCLKPGWLLVSQGEIRALGQTGRQPWPEKADEVHFLDGVMVIPSLIDAHVHLDLDPGTGLDLLARAEYAASWGIVAVRDGGDKHCRVLGARKRIEQHLYTAVSGTALFRPGRYGSFIGSPVTDRSDMITAIKDLSEAGVDQIKILASGPVNLDLFGQVGPPQFSLEELTLIVTCASQFGLPVMAHANGAESVRLCRQAGVTTVEHGYFMGADVLAELGAEGVAWIPTIEPLAVLAAKEKDKKRRQRLKRIIDRQVEQLALARDMKVRTILGTDAGCPGVICGPGLYREMTWWRKAGFSSDRIIEAGTSAPAKLMGWSNRIGRLEIGCRAYMTGLFLDQTGEPILSEPPALVTVPKHDLQENDNC